MTRRVVALGLAAGILAGVITASAVPSHRTRTITASSSRARPGRIRIGRPEQVAPGEIRLRRAGARHETVLADPRGGPPWVLDTFLGKRIVPKGQRRAHVSPVIGHGWCAELGRRYRRHLGWIDATDTFHRGQNVFGAMPIVCGSRLPDMRGLPLYTTIIRITDPSAPTAHTTEAAIYGIAGPATTAVDITDAGRPVHVSVDRNGGFLAMLPRRVLPGEVHVIVHYGTRRAPVSSDGYGVLGSHALPAYLTSRMAKLARATRPIADTFAPDPLGGVPYAIAAARDRSGHWCASTGGERLVDGRVGDVDPRLGTFLPISPTRLAFGCVSSSTLTRARPLSFGWGGGYALDRAADERGRIARRTQHGTFDIGGIARSDVRQIVIVTPRDVRTITPGSRAHSFLVVYDGQFVSGHITLTSVFADGHRHTDRIGDLGLG